MKLTNDPSNPAFAASFVPDIAEPPVIEIDGSLAPRAPTRLKETGIDADSLSNLALKAAYTVPRFTTQWAAQKLCLPLQIVGEILEGLRRHNLLEVLGQSGPFGFQFAITGRGREHAARLLEISGYVGPAPVSLESYTKHLELQFDHMPELTRDQVQAAIADLILPDEVAEVAGLAMMSRRSLFLYGPPGNGKTSLSHLLHNAVRGDLWIPHCLGIDDNIIRVFDHECHQATTAEIPSEMSARIDQRWVRVRRPFIVVAGELTMDSLDLVFSRNLGYYEAPLHFKANGGTFVIDDFGCQRVEPQQLLNRWILPLERHVDYLTLQTGQQLEVPFRQMLVVSTNLDPEKIMSPAFLRRMGYRLHLDNPSADRYVEIFRRYAASRKIPEVPRELTDRLLERYRRDKRALRSCEPRDLIERAGDICRFRNQPLTLNAETLDLAWRGYFGNETTEDR